MDIDIRKFRFVAAVGDGKETACLMSARALLDGRGLTDEHPSRVIRGFGIRINDANWWESDAERSAVLLEVALDQRMCGASVDASPAAEQVRLWMLADWSIRNVVPQALESAAFVLELCKEPERAAKLKAHAEGLRALDEVTAANWSEARAASLRAREDARRAAYAAAYAADAAYAAYAADAADAADAAAAYAADAATAAADAAYAADAAAYAAAYAAADHPGVGIGWAAKRKIRTEAIAMLLRLCEVGLRAKGASAA